MKKIETGNRRAPSRKTYGVALLGMAAVFAGGFAHAERAAGTGCRQETRRVAVWPKSPRAQQIAKFEQREVTVCDGKVVSRKAVTGEARGSSN